MLAKLASSQNKPNKQTIVPSSGVQSLMLTLPLKNIRGLGGKLGAQVVKQLFPVQAGADANLHASDLQPFSEAELSRLFGGKTAVWLSRVCRGHDDEPVKERDKSKSILAFKSFSAVKTPGETIDRWLRMLSEELADRVLSERDTHSRAPRTVVLHFRGRTLGSRSMPMSSGATADGVTEAASAAILYEQAHTLLGRAGAEAFPCTRLALGAADFRESMTGQGSISHFFSAQATSSGHKSQPTPEGPLTSSSPVANQMSPSSLRSADSKDAVELSSFSAKVSPDSNHIARLASAPEKRSADPARVAFPLAEEKEAEVASVSARGPAEVKQDAISKHKAHGTQQQGMMQFLHSTSQAGSQVRSPPMLNVEIKNCGITTNGTWPHRLPSVS